MKNWLKHKYALSDEGANDMIKACISVTCTNIVLMMSSGILYMLIKDLLEDNLTSDRIWIYALASAGVILLIAITNFIQYNATFLSTYRESGRRHRRGSLEENKPAELQGDTRVLQGIVYRHHCRRNPDVVYFALCESNAVWKNQRRQR